MLQIDLQLASETGGDTSGYITNGEWDLKGSNILVFKYRMHFNYYTE